MAGQDLIFTKGMEGSFDLLPPFTNAVRAKARYTVRSVRTISAIIANKEDPRALYQQYNVDDASYIRDLQADVCIIGLQATTGEWVYVPQSFIASYPQISGVSYRPLAVVAPLGSIADDTELSDLLAAIDALVADRLGVSSTSRLVAVGAAELQSPDEHARIVLARETMVKVTETQAARIVRLDRENSQLRQEKAALEDAVKKLAMA